MKSACLIVLAVGLVNVATGKMVSETYLDREFRMCGPELFATLDRICSVHGYNPSAIYTPDLTQSINKMCCERKCKVSDVVITFCRKQRYWYDIMWARAENERRATTKRTTTKTPMTMSAVKVPTTTEKLASVWYLTG